MEISRRDFPSVTGSNLNGRTFEFPRDFAGKLTIAGIAFRIEHRTALETWVPAIERMVTTRTGIVGLAFAILPPPMRFGRKAIEAAMHRAMSEVQREVSVLVFTDVARLASALGIGSDAFALLLVDARGMIVWQTSGAYSAAAGEELRSAVERGI